MPRALLLVLGLGLSFFEPRGASAFAPSAAFSGVLKQPRAWASRRAPPRMCLGEKPPGQDSDAEGADPPVAAGGEDEGGPFKGVLDFVLQPVTMPLAASVGSVFAGSLVMTLSIGFVLVHWAFSPPSPGGTALGGTPPPGIVQEQARQTTLSQKSVLFEEVPPTSPSRP